MNEWISVDDRLPDSERCLAVYRSKKGAIYNMRHDSWFIDTIYSCKIGGINGSEFIIESHGPSFPATHWMKLPQIPENENE